MKILSLDMATQTGWATNVPETSGTENFAVKRGESPGMRYIRFVAWLRQILDIVKPDMVVYEQAHHRGGASTEVAHGFSTHLQATLAEYKIEYMSQHTGTIKKFALGEGKGGGKKADMIAAYEKKWGVPPQDDNESDARWLLELTMFELGIVHEKKDTDKKKAPNTIKKAKTQKISNRKTKKKTHRKI